MVSIFFVSIHTVDKMLSTEREETLLQLVLLHERNWSNCHAEVMELLQDAKGEDFALP